MNHYVMFILGSYFCYVCYVTLFTGTRRPEASLSQQLRAAAWLPKKKLSDWPMGSSNNNVLDGRYVMIYVETIFLDDDVSMKGSDFL